MQIVLIWRRQAILLVGSYRSICYASSRMQKLPKAIRDATESFEKLPGIGPKSAQRLAFYLLHWPEYRLQEFADHLMALKKNVVLCSKCHGVSESDPCPICSDQARDQTVLMVVEQPLDLLAVENSDSYHGLYHVLHGAIAPLHNIGPEQLFLHDISTRLTDSKVVELILATNPTLEGEGTALYIKDYLEKNVPTVYSQLTITRIGHGLPIGADIEYADGITLRRALEGRRSV